MRYHRFKVYMITAFLAAGVVMGTDSLTASAETARDYGKAAGIYNSGNSAPSNTYSNVPPPTKSEIFGAIWEGLKTLGNLGNGDASGRGIITGSGGDPNNNVRRYTEQPNYSSPTAQAARNATHATNMIANNTSITGNDAVDAVIGQITEKASYETDKAQNVQAVNDYTNKNPESTAVTDRALRWAAADALIDEGHDKEEVDAFIHGGEQELQKVMEQKSAKEQEAESRYQTWKTLARFARERDAREKGNTELADAIAQGKEREYYAKIRNAGKDASSSNTNAAKGNGVEKPNIYLYPAEETAVAVNFGEPDKLTRTIPAYQTGWEVLAEPDGTLTVPDAQDPADTEKYGFLFYESIAEGFYFQRREGFIVPADSRESVFREILSQYGLNETETDDFVEYWSDRLEEGVDYIMYPQLNETVDAVMPMEITPAPDSVLRLWFVFDEDTSREITAPTVDAFARNGFSVVEWGGTLW
ncbi:MAG: hypothetical protein J6M66_13670 [Lachnospiraceae bacterium]|nr:hypothetical protein [Lachnospiraceae bacterium]